MSRKNGICEGRTARRHEPATPLKARPLSCRYRQQSFACLLFLPSDPSQRKLNGTRWLSPPKFRSRHISRELPSSPLCLPPRCFALCRASSRKGSASSSLGNLGVITRELLG